jgi:hypothetical protein
VRVVGADHDRADAGRRRSRSVGIRRWLRDCGGGKGRAWHHLKRGQGGQWKKRNGPSARGHAEAVGGCVPGAQKHRQTIRRIALVPKTPIRVSRSTAGAQLSRIPRLKIPACAECAVAGFCHEVRLRFDLAMPTGRAGGLDGARRRVVLETHLASGRLVASGRSRITIQQR